MKTYRLDGKVTIETMHPYPGIWKTCVVSDPDVFDHLCAILTDHGDRIAKPLERVKLDKTKKDAMIRHADAVAFFDAAMMAYTFGAQP